MRVLRTMEDFIGIAHGTPYGEPVGLTHREILNLEAIVGYRFRWGLLLLGNRVVPIPHDWEAELESVTTITTTGQPD